MSERTVVAVAGLARSGTSCTAGMIHHLGVSMGLQLRPADERNPRGYFEDDVLLWAATDLRMSSETRILLFKQYESLRYTRQGEGMIGMKVGRLCLLIPELVSAFPRLKVVVPERPMKEVIRSQQNSRMWPGWGRKRLCGRMRIHRAKREEDIITHNVDVLRLPYHDTVNDPKGAIRKLIDFLGINPTEEQIQTAVEFVSPSLSYCGSTS